MKFKLIFLKSCRTIGQDRRWHGSNQHRYEGSREKSDRNGKMLRTLRFTMSKVSRGTISTENIIY